MWGESKSRMINSWRWAVPFMLVMAVGLLNGCDSKKQKVYRIGILSGLERHIKAIDGFTSKMAELGYVEGKNITYDIHRIEADPAGEERIAQKFVSDKVDLIFAFPTEPAVRVKAAIQGTGIPLVFGNAGIEGTGLVKSVREPGENVTGVRYPGPEMQVKRFELLLEVAPHIKRLYIAYDPDYPNNGPALKELRPAAFSKGIRLVEAPVKSVQALEMDLKARENATDVGMDAIMLLSEILTQLPGAWDTISRFGERHRLPVAGVTPSTADTGAVLSYSPNVVGWGEQAALLADKILRGTPAGTIPVISTETELRINFRRAQALGLKVPEGMLKMANTVIR